MPKFFCNSSLILASHIMRIIDINWIIIKNIYLFIKSQAKNAHVTIKVQTIRNMAHWPITLASYTIGSETTMQENQPATQIARHNIFLQMGPYMS